MRIKYHIQYNGKEDLLVPKIAEQRDQPQLLLSWNYHYISVITKVSVSTTNLRIGRGSCKSRGRCIRIIAMEKALKDFFWGLFRT